MAVPNCSPMRFLVLFSMLGFIAGVLSCSSREPADTVIFGGTIHTMESDNPTVEAVAVRNGRVYMTGSKVDVLRLMDDNTIMSNL